MIIPVRSVPRVLARVSTNLRKLLSLAWKMDPRLTALYYATAILGAFGPIAVSLMAKYLIDSLTVAQVDGVTFSSVVVAILAINYAIFLGDKVFHQILNRTYLDYLFRYKLQNELNYRFFQKMSRLDIAHLEDPKAQNLITKAKDTFTWRLPGLLHDFAHLTSYLTAFVTAFIVLIPFGWWVPLAVSLVALPQLYIQAKFGNIQWSIYGSGAPEVRKLWYLTWLLGDRTAITEMRIFQSQRVLLAKLKKTQDYIFRLNKKPLDRYFRAVVFPPLLEAAVLLAISLWRLPLALSGVMTVGSFALLISMLSRLSYSVGVVVSRFGDIYASNLYADHYFEVLGLPRVIKEKREAVVFDELSPPELEFKNVTFAYPDGPTVLKNISFTMKPGENVAFVGPNGAGKSTIIKLICRFYDVDGGEILVNDVNIKDLRLSNWYRFLGTLFQDFVRYKFPVWENIALGNVRRGDEDQVRAAAESADALNFIEELPDGLDQMLGREFDGGVDLSIGQWQKLALARAFYEEAPLLILDEPTSAVDAEAEYEIFNNLRNSYRDKSLVFVSHRFSTVRNADRIYVVEDGEITERGTHEELLALEGKYARMFAVQAKGYE